MRSKTIPADAEVLRTYDELREFRDSFFRGKFYFQRNRENRVTNLSLGEKP
jgi:hypothetical protein